jgi:hypothetical protein
MKMKVVKEGIINGEKFEGRIETDTVPFVATITIAGKAWFTQTFPTFESAEACIIETWDALKASER